MVDRHREVLSATPISADSRIFETHGPHEGGRGKPGKKGIYGLTKRHSGQPPIFLINNDGTDAVTGTFSGLAEGARVMIGGVSYVISYQKVKQGQPPGVIKGSPPQLTAIIDQIRTDRGS